MCEFAKGDYGPGEPNWIGTKLPGDTGASPAAGSMRSLRVINRPKITALYGGKCGEELGIRAQQFGGPLEGAGPLVGRVRGVW